MGQVLINALASTAGGGVTYLRNVLPRLGRIDPARPYLVLVPPGQLAACRGLAGGRVRVETARVRGGALGRFAWEQAWLRPRLRRRAVDVLVSLGNFALLAAPVPQILFNRNDLYFSPDFARDLRARGRYGALVAHAAKSWLARLSARTAAVNVAPTAAFAERVCARAGGARPFVVLPFGFDPAVFAADAEPPDEALLGKLAPNRRRLLYVSHYNYFRNFETLLRALPRLRELTGGGVQLVLTTDLRRGAVYGGYDATAAAELIDRLGVRDEIAMLGPVPYGKLHHLYACCDVFVCPSYSESFGHPLVEAMASGLPVVAADLPVHREVCGEAARYFPVFDGGALAEECAGVLADDGLRAGMAARGLARAQEFSWDEHVRGLVAVIDDCLARGGRGETRAARAGVRAEVKS